jgi:hypothetical protein
VHTKAHQQNSPLQQRKLIQECHTILCNLASRELTETEFVEFKVAMITMRENVFMRKPESRNYHINLEQQASTVSINLQRRSQTETLFLNMLAPRSTQFLLGERYLSQPASFLGNVDHVPKVWFAKHDLEFAGSMLLMLHEIGHLYSLSTKALFTALDRHRLEVKQSLQVSKTAQLDSRLTYCTNHNAFLPLSIQATVAKIEENAEQEAWQWAMSQAKNIDPTFNILEEIGAHEDLELFIKSSLLTHQLTQARNLVLATKLAYGA